MHVKKKPNVFISVTWYKAPLLYILIWEKKKKHALNSSACNVRKQETAFVSDVLYGYSSSGKSPAGSKWNKRGNSAKADLDIAQRAAVPFGTRLFMELSNPERKRKDSWNVWVVTVFLMSH